MTDFSGRRNLCHLPIEVLSQIDREVASHGYKATISLDAVLPEESWSLILFCYPYQPTNPVLNQAWFRLQIEYFESATHQYRLLFYYANPQSRLEQENWLTTNQTDGSMTVDPGWIRQFIRKLEAHFQ